MAGAQDKMLPIHEATGRGKSQLYTLTNLSCPGDKILRVLHQYSPAQPLRVILAKSQRPLEIGHNKDCGNRMTVEINDHNAPSKHPSFVSVF
jgi:hypothetical protein